MTIFLLASPEVVAAFALGGIPGHTANSRREALEAMEKIRQRQDLRLLVIEEAAAAMVREEIEQLKLNPRGPLVAEVPGFAGPAEGRPDVMGMIRHALGISL